MKSITFKIRKTGRAPAATENTTVPQVQVLFKQKVLKIFDEFVEMTPEYVLFLSANTR